MIHTMKQEIVVTNLRIPKQQWIEIKVRSAELGISANEYIKKILTATTNLESISDTIKKVTKKSKKKVSFYDAMIMLSKIPQGKQKFDLSKDDKTAAWKWFTQKWSRLSFTDCVCFAQMKRLGLERVFTFDAHFKKAGFKIE